ncbi:hypothetical protein JCM15519_11580 [Fundidesulfovibrio butyratiphilus]
MNLPPPSDRSWPPASRRPLRNAFGIKVYIMIMLVLLAIIHAILLFNLTKYLYNLL